MNITESELLDALATASTAPEDARTVCEMVAATGHSEDKIRRALKVFHAAGRLVAHRVRRMAIDGRNSQSTAYTILPVPGPARKSATKPTATRAR